MIERAEESAGRPELRPVERRAVWVVWGFALQAVGVGLPVTVALRLANEDGVLGSITHYTARLVWHEMLRSSADLALVGVGVIIFVAGSVVLARPFVTRRSTLFITVPVAATVGIIALGVIALVCAALIALVGSASDTGGRNLLDGFSSLSGARPRKRRK